MLKTPSAPALDNEVDVIGIDGEGIDRNCEAALQDGKTLQDSLVIFLGEKRGNVSGFHSRGTHHNMKWALRI
jgi:hypothetical protein